MRSSRKSGFSTHAVLSGLLAPRQARTHGSDPNRTAAALLVAAALVLIFAGKANAGINYWTTRGPQGGRVSALVVDPVTPANLYSGTEMGVFKSTDRTGSWFVPSQDLMGLSVYSLAIDPITPTTLYAGAGAEFCCSGVFKSTDAGVSWTAVGTGVTSDAFALAIDPTDPATIYAGGSDGAIFKSTDAGNTWTTVLSPAPAGSINALAIDPATPSTIYAADAEGVLKSVDGGETWSWAGAGLPAGVVVALAIHPNVTTTLYAGTVESGVFQSVDGGDTWSAANSGLPDTTVQAIAIDPATPTTLYAGTSDRGVFKSTDAGGTWTSFNDGLGNFDVSTVVIDPHTPKIVYAGTSSRVYQMDQRTIPNLVFLVNGTEDAHDADPGDGICDDGTGVCTLRAAAEESAWWSNIGPCQEGAIESGATLAVSGDIDLNAPVSFQAGGCYRSVTVTGPGAGSLTIRGGGLIFGGSAGAGERASVSGVTVTAAPVGITYLGAALGYPRDVSLSDLVVIGNGTGIEYGFRTRLTLRNCVIAENAADGIGLIPSLAGNSIEIFDSAVRNNGGAGILANVLRIVVARSIVSGNAGEGVTAGGIGQPYVEISDSTISSNGGAGLSIRSQGASIAGSTISGNAGGGVLLRAGPLMMMNSTVSGNESVGSGGGVFVSATGGGPVTLRNVTVADNTADSDGDGTGDGGGIYVELGTVTLSNTIVAGNTDRGGESPDCGGGLTSGGYNLILNTTGCVITGDPTGNLIGVEPFLGTLEDNGGLTETIALLPRSPAIDAANPGGCVDADGQPLTTDQRGVARPQLAACDIGAYEFACGNSVVDVAEECDDGNAIQGDGCSDVCEVEPGFECSGEPSICVSRLPEVSVSPQQYDFGQVDLGTSSTQIVTVSNTGGASLNVSDLALLPGVGAGFAFESPVSLPLEIAPGATVDVGLSFTPVDDGAASATLQITSDDPDEPLIEVPLTGFGVSYDEQSMALLTFFDELVASGDLVGEGPGNSAPGRLNALRNMIEASGDLIEQGQTAEACGQLEDARRRTDGLFPPPDFASGPAAPDLEAEIAQLRSNLRCDDPPATSLVRSGGTGRCGLGVELAFALPALAWLRRDRRRSAAA